MLDVPTLVGWHFADLDCGEWAIPSWGVVSAALPGVVDGDQPRPLRVPGSQQIAVPGQQARVVVFEKRACARHAPLLFAPRALPDAPDGDGVDRRLAEAAGARLLGSIRGYREGAGLVQDLMLLRRNTPAANGFTWVRRPVVALSGELCGSSSPCMDR